MRGGERGEHEASRGGERARASNAERGAKKERPSNAVVDAGVRGERHERSGDGGGAEGDGGGDVRRGDERGGGRGGGPLKPTPGGEGVGDGHRRERVFRVVG